MSTTKSRWLPKGAAAVPSGVAAAGPTVEEALLNAEPVLFRVRARYDRGGILRRDLIAYDSDFRRVEFDYADAFVDEAIRAGLVALMLEEFPHVDWRKDHQVFLADGCVHAAPLPEDPGGVPEADYSFGEPRPPVLLAVGVAV